MRKKFLIAVFTASLLTLTPLTANACKSCYKNEKKEKKLCKISKIKEKVMLLWMHKDYLGLDENQISQLKQIKHESIKSIIKTQAQIDILKIDIKSALWADEIDKNALNKLIDQKYQNKANIAKIYVAVLADIQKVLTKEQNEKVKEMALKAKLGGSCPVSECKKCYGSSESKMCPWSKGEKGSGKGSMKGSMK